MLSLLCRLRGLPTRESSSPVGSICGMWTLVLLIFHGMASLITQTWMSWLKEGSLTQTPFPRDCAVRCISSTDLRTLCLSCSFSCFFPEDKDDSSKAADNDVSHESLDTSTSAQGSSQVSTPGAAVATSTSLPQVPMPVMPPQQGVMPGKQLHCGLCYVVAEIYFQCGCCCRCDAHDAAHDDAWHAPTSATSGHDALGWHAPTAPWDAPDSRPTPGFPASTCLNTCRLCGFCFLHRPGDICSPDCTHCSFIITV